MKSLSLLIPIFLIACASSNQQPVKHQTSDTAEVMPRAVANEVYSNEDETLYKKLAVKEEYISRGANSIRFQKQVGRLTCIKVVAKSDNVTVGYECTLQENTNDGYAPSDEFLYNAIISKEVPFMRGVNSIRTQKNAGNLSCSKVIARSDKVIVGYECNM